MKSQIATLLGVLKHSFSAPDTRQYPEQQPYLAPRYRGRIVLTRDPDGNERCVACNLCATVCPVDCIALQKTELEDGRWIAETFDINFARCIMCGFCEEACPTHAIQLTPDFEMAEYDRQNLLYRKEHLLIDGTGKYHDYHFYQVSGKVIAGKGKGQGVNELAPIDIKSLLP
ncbi:MAG: NADH-quinone oxidoreductase subunit NuoI [Oceanospirillaceae bacterium]|nr:NADH-quinone oxidoreductase subunit NuoI [Oceanospirillaceae bacterium]